MKQQEDQGHSERQFVEGDHVFLLSPTVQENFTQIPTMLETCTKILWSLYYSQTHGPVALSVSFAQSLQATSCF
jgi:hypothetical protein